MLGLIFTYLMTYGGALVSLFHPFYGFLIYVIFANLRPEALWFWSVPRGNYSRVIAISLFIGWFINGLGRWNFGRSGSIVLLLVLYWLWLLLGAMRSPAQVEAWYAFDVISKVFLPVMVSLTLIDSLDKLKLLAWALVLSQGYLAYEFNMQYYRHMIDVNEWYFAGLDNNGIAITMVSTLGLAFFLGLTTTIWWQRLLAFICSAFMTHVILFSMSRGGMLALAVTAVVCLLLIPKRPIFFLYMVIGALIVARLAGPQVLEEFGTIFATDEERDASAESRVVLTKNALDCMLRNPVFGCGYENWGNVAPQYGWRQGKRVHNTWAETGASLGIPGLILIVGLYAATIWQMIRVLRLPKQEVDPWVVGISRAVLAGLTGFIVSATFVTVDRVELPYYLILLAAGAVKLDLAGAKLARTEQPRRAWIGDGLITSPPATNPVAT